MRPTVRWDHHVVLGPWRTRCSHCHSCRYGSHMNLCPWPSSWQGHIQYLLDTHLTKCMQVMCGRSSSSNSILQTIVNCYALFRGPRRLDGDAFFFFQLSTWRFENDDCIWSLMNVGLTSWGRKFGKYRLGVGWANHCWAPWVG